MKRFIIASVVAVAAIFTVQAQASTIVFYSFNTNGYSGSLALPLSAAGE